MFTVLIVDDHPGFRASARKLLEAEGYTVVGEAEDGAAAIAGAAALAPEVVLLDIQLPDLDGFEVARRLTEQLPGSHIVLISSRDAFDYGPALNASAARGFLPKANLSGMALTKLLGRGEANPSAVRSPRPPPTRTE